MGVQHYDRSFKEQAAKLSEERGNISVVAGELCVSSSQLSKCCKSHSKFGSNSFPGEKSNDFRQS